MPVPSFPDLVFAAGGSPAAIRELAKSYQVQWQLRSAHCIKCSTAVGGTWVRQCLQQQPCSSNQPPQPRAAHAFLPADSGLYA